MQSDPFYEVKNQVMVTFSQLQPQVDQYVSMQASAQNDARSKQVGRDVKSKLQTIQAHLDDLQQTVEIVKANRASFPQISDQELNTRQTFIDERRKQFTSIRTTLQNAKPSRRTLDDQRSSLTGQSRQVAQEDRTPSKPAASSLFLMRERVTMI